jgi:hypothetical protein
MKNTNQQHHPGRPGTKPVKQPNSNKRRAENKDNLDSREGEEQQFKGDDITHNKKDVQNSRQSKKNR